MIDNVDDFGIDPMHDEGEDDVGGDKSE